ncbi:putative hydrogen peroxide-inducible genes activator [Candidatus Terasakiella magnetica]|uniref:Putative hydrogen peroxide-inducible genes activator n=1 Tax=Candidatus Terasakiella magnetica TaxID=1867952 RepID=A0A1C3RKG2_9PROT|nr:hydrogen peroxide-inducible genes activator [Candidatus Terasakiella magnetica]SCA57810.1 putative hydrogen peroxide-inducible genes activator [Candidatus Terasakiella magnetica]
MNATYTLKHLKYFMAVAQHQHFGKAAQACFVTQPTLSAAIKEFEEILGLQLFERTKRSVLLTSVGEELLERAKEISIQADALMELAQSRRAPLSGELRLGVIPTIAPYLLPKFMHAVRDSYPDLTLYLKEDQTERLLSSLHNGQLDILILALPYEHDGIESYTFMQDPFYCAFPKTHKLGRKKSIKNEDIFEETLLLLEEGHCLRDHALAACSWPQKQQTNEFGGTSLTTLVQMVANGLGLTLLPEMAVQSGITNGCDITAIPLAKESPPRDIGLVWRKTSGRGDEFKMLGSFLEESL